jgi:membrane-bound lytic murein transglycosylase
MVSESYQAKWKREDRKKFPEKYKKYKSTYYEKNKKQVLERVKEYQEKKRKKSKYQSHGYAYHKDISLMRNYGIGLDVYQKMYDEQLGNCKICGVYQEVLNVDHCHNSKAIRGLLCQKCNQGIGLFKDSEVLLANAIEYLVLGKKKK